MTAELKKQLIERIEKELNLEILQQLAEMYNYLYAGRKIDFEKFKRETHTPEEVFNYLYDRFCACFGFTNNIFENRRRFRYIVLPKQLFYFFLINFLRSKYNGILSQRMFEQLTHAHRCTMLHGYKTIENYLKIYGDKFIYYEQIQLLKKELGLK